MRVSDLINLVANTRLGVIPYPHVQIPRRYNGTVNIYVSLRTIMEPLALFLLLLLLLLLLLVVVVVVVVVVILKRGKRFFCPSKGPDRLWGPHILLFNGTQRSFLEFQVTGS